MKCLRARWLGFFCSISICISTYDSFVRVYKLTNPTGITPLFIHNKLLLEIWWLGFLCLCMVLVLTGSWLFAPTFLLRLTTHETTSHMVITFNAFILYTVFNLVSVELFQTVLDLNFALYCSCANSTLLFKMKIKLYLHVFFLDTNKCLNFN